MACANRRSSLEDFTTLPLDTQTIQIINKKGKTKNISAIHYGFAEKRVFLPYKSPTIAGEEWMEMTSYLIEDLNWLLRLNHQRFWCQVIFDEDLHKCLTSYLQEAPRSYDLHNLMTTPEMETQHQTIHKLVFQVYLRMSTYKESKSCHMNPKVFGNFIYDKFIFDIPILMDLCILYGNENRAILHKMIDNIFFYQPAYFNDLFLAVPTILQSFESIERKLGLKSKQLLSPKENNKKANVVPMPLEQLQDLIVYIADIAANLSAFLDLYSPACDKFRQHQTECRLAQFYETVFKPLEEELKSREKECQAKTFLFEELMKRITMSKASLIKTFRDILVSCCIQPLLDANDANSVSGQQHVEDFLQIVSTCLNEKRFFCDYETNFPFEEDLIMLNQTKSEIDSTRTSFIVRSINSYMGLVTNEPYEVLNGTFNTENNTLSSMARRYQDQLDCEAKSDGATGASSAGAACLEGATASSRLTGVELDSLISHVQDMFPDLGAGFIDMALEYFDYKPEPVINALLEDSLPDPLKHLDRKLAAISSEVEAVPKKPPCFADLISERKNIFDNDEMDVFTRDTVDKSKIHRGKKEIGSATRLLDDKQSVRESKAIYNRYEITSALIDVTSDMYEDEYDDTYDGATNVTWTDEPTPFDEIALGRKFTIPRVLRKEGDWTEEESEEDDENEEIPINSNHGAAKQIANSEPNSSRGGSNSVRGKPKGQGQDDKTQHSRKNKEQNKGVYSNHNRRAGADRKRNQGMMFR